MAIVSAHRKALAGRQACACLRPCSDCALQPLRIALHFVLALLCTALHFVLALLCTALHFVLATEWRVSATTWHRAVVGAYNRLCRCAHACTVAQPRKANRDNGSGGGPFTAVGGSAPEQKGLQAPEESPCGDKAFHVFAFELGIGVDSAAACELAQLLVIDEDGLVGLDVD